MLGQKNRDKGVNTTKSIGVQFSTRDLFQQELSDSLLTKIAAELNYAETAYIQQLPEGDFKNGKYQELVTKVQGFVSSIAPFTQGISVMLGHPSMLININLRCLEALGPTKLNHHLR